MSGKIPPLPLLRAGKVYTCGEEGNGKRVWEREDVETARLCFNWSQQVQLGVEVTYRINKKKKGSHSRCRLVPFPLKRLETDCFMLKRILNYLSAPSWLASKSNAPKRWRNEARITSLSHSSRRLSSPCLAPCRPASLIPNLLRAHTCVWLGGWARRRRVHPTNSAASAAQDWETSAGICGAIFPGMLHPLNPSTERKIPQKSQMGKKKEKSRQAPSLHGLETSRGCPCLHTAVRAEFISVCSLIRGVFHPSSKKGLRWLQSRGDILKGPKSPHVWSLPF